MEPWSRQLSAFVSGFVVPPGSVSCAASPAIPRGLPAPVPQLPTTGPIPDSLAPLLDWITANLDHPLTIEDMAVHSGLSPRTLSRHFTDQLGVSPGRWLLDRRIASTRALLEETDLPVETIAQRVGLSSAVNLRRRFHKALHTTPAAYRRSFR
ncbi:helix-turn-helix domain-containing protein [Streptosporangium canum]|uniref:helix-turn-helix domain-containing protein n=1 Tax=Streptosporangium canum TaxID=324952 RepID=UPI00368E7E35